MSGSLSRAGVIIIGSNSTRMLTADLDAGLSNPAFGRRDTRLFLALGAGRRLPLEAIQTACRDVGQLLALARESESERTLLLATSAVRESENRRELAYALLQATGLSLQVLTGDEEAAFSFWGAVHPFPARDMAGVVDIGGGSTEIALGYPDELPLTHSLPLGAARLYAMQPVNSPDDLDKALQAAAGVVQKGISALARKTLTHSPRLWEDPERWLMVGGTGTALIGLMQGKLYGRGQPDALFSREQVLGILRRLASLSPEERAALPGMTPGREHVLPTGLALLYSLMEALGLQTMAATCRNNTDGVLGRLAQRGSLRLE